jgi:hypothetical protein
MRHSQQDNVNYETYVVRANGIRIEHIKTTNQSAIIEYLQKANARLHSSLIIKKIA